MVNKLKFYHKIRVFIYNTPDKQVSTYPVIFNLKMIKINTQSKIKFVELKIECICIVIEYNNYLTTIYRCILRKNEHTVTLNKKKRN